MASTNLQARRRRRGLHSAAAAARTTPVTAATEQNRVSKCKREEMMPTTECRGATVTD
ncbi:hypothetical protein WN943_027148 [Citrus x changshan-huyou]